MEFVAMERLRGGQPRDEKPYVQCLTLGIFLQFFCGFHRIAGPSILL